MKFNQVDVDDEHIDFLFLSNRSLLFCNIPIAIFRKQLPVYNFYKIFAVTNNFKYYNFRKQRSVYKLNNFWFTNFR